MVDILALVLQHDEQAVLSAVDMALKCSVSTKTQVLNLLHRLVNGKSFTPPTVDTPRCLRRLADDQGISLGFYSLDLCEQQAIEFSVDFCFQMFREWPTIANLKLV